MLAIPEDIDLKYSALLKQRQEPESSWRNFKKWLRFYLDFCHKYKHEPNSKQSQHAFNNKLIEKQQSHELRSEAWQAVNLYFHLLHDQAQPLQIVPQPVKADSWDEVYEKLKNAVAVRHYSPRTLTSYRGWVRKLQAFVQNRSPEEIGMPDVEAFLTGLATRQHVSASTQNQAFNALLFLFRHVLHQEFQPEGVVRAKYKRRIPVVLSREEVDAVLGKLRHPYNLIASLLYGCGLRLSEGIKLRVQDIDFDARRIIVHDGKGGKDRGLPLPESLVEPLREQLERVKRLHTLDLEAGYAGVILPGALSSKYRGAAKDYCWQWLFPAKTLTLIPEAGENRRYHIHDSHVQKAIKSAVRRAQIPKRATAHTLRHSFASHLLAANYDIRTIQELLGHANLKTTMIYTHTVQSQTMKEAKSPLDF